MNTYIHNYTGMEITEDAYMALPFDQRRDYKPKRQSFDTVEEDIIDIVTLGLINEAFGSDSSGSCSTDFGSSESSDSSSGFDGGFDGGDFSGGGAGSDW